MGTFPDERIHCRKSPCDEPPAVNLRADGFPLLDVDHGLLISEDVVVGFSFSYFQPHFPVDGNKLERHSHRTLVFGVPQPLKYLPGCGQSGQTVLYIRTCSSSSGYI